MAAHVTFEVAGDYALTAIAKDSQGREFSSAPVAVKVIPNLSLSLTASVMDGLGRAFTYEQTIEVYPVLSLTLTADAATHTDEQINVSLSKDTDLPVTWKITPSNDPSAAVEYTGNLTDNGGTHPDHQRRGL